MVGNGRCYWMKWEERAGLERRVGPLGFHNYNNFIFAAETHFMVKYPHFGYCTQLRASQQRDNITL